MSSEFSRTELLLGRPAMEKLKKSRIAVFGIGGVGGHIAEALVRSGVGTLALIDNDTISLSNINRQIIATHSSVGKYKVDVAKERFLDINPDCKITTFKTFYMPETANEIDFKEFDYVIDAIDTVTGKIAIIENAKKAGVMVISSMGTGNKLNPTAFEVTDIYKTSVCPLARVMRYELKKRGIDNLKVVYSKEAPIKVPDNGTTDGSVKRQAPGSTAFCPSVAGLIIASEVIKDLIK